ncbi:Hypothetical predicted protein [Podarcis lilfordi]|nr:Hypothetical predicted protein [Podarcis lilfordi]
MGALFLLTAILQSFVERSTAGVTIHFKEVGQNYSFYINDTFEYFYTNDSDYYDKFEYDEYEEIEKLPRPNDSTGPLHPCSCALFFVSLLHTLPVILRVLDARH